MKVLDTELYVGYAAVIVLDYRIADIDRIPGLDMGEMLCLVEGDG